MNEGGLSTNFNRILTPYKLEERIARFFFVKSGLTYIYFCCLFKVRCISTTRFYPLNQQPDRMKISTILWAFAKKRNTRRYAPSVFQTTDTPTGKRGAIYFGKQQSPLIALLFLILLTSACAVPQKVIRMAPDESENVFWYQGQAIAEKKQDSIVVRAAFSHANREYLIFDVEVFNERPEPILVSPEVMSLANTTGIRHGAMDPEQVLLTMEIDQSRQEANAKNAAIVGGVVLVGAAVAVAVSDNDSDSSDDDWEYDDYDAADVVVDAVLPAVSLGLSFHQASVLSTPVDEIPTTNDAYFWQDVVLRRTTLRPGEHIRGLVAFPRFDESRELNLLIPVESEDFTFLFTQRVFHP